jgi:hypothetical protein
MLGTSAVTEARTMRLNHFTCIENLPAILSSGHLLVTESNVSRKREHAGPDVVWLTTSDDPSLGHGLQGSSADKTRIRFAVGVPKREVARWHDFAREFGMERGAISELAAAGGSGTWRVIRRPIPASEWLEIIDLRSGEAIPW